LPKDLKLNNTKYRIKNDGTVIINNSRLPDEYQEVEYIESTGTQYIDTAFLPDSNSGLEVKSQFIDNIGTQISGSGWLENQRLNFGIANSGLSIAYGKWYSIAGVDLNAHVYKIDQNNNTVSIDNMSFDITSSYQRESNLTFYLFARNRTGDIDYNCKMRLYYCKLFDNTTLERHLIPCYRKLDKKPGLYDLVNNVFYTNQGTGDDFVAGPENDFIEGPEV